MKYKPHHHFSLLLLAACSAGETANTTSSGAPVQLEDASGGTAEGGAVQGNGNYDAGRSLDAGGNVDAGKGPTKDAGGGMVVPGQEICDNGRDDDVDGLVDENCFCTPGKSQACYFGPPESAGQICPAGLQQCRGSEFAAWGPCESTGAPFPTNACQCFPELCNNNKDDNCNNQIDEGCLVMHPVDVQGDCVRASCPAWAPYPVGCNLTMDGNDGRGCVASTPTGSEVYFQEGVHCGAGRVTGTLTCSSQPGAPLTQQNCALNKDEKFFVQNADQCP